MPPFSVCVEEGQPEHAPRRCTYTVPSENALKSMAPPSCSTAGRTNSSRSCLMVSSCSEGTMSSSAMNFTDSGSSPAGAAAGASDTAEANLGRASSSLSASTASAWSMSHSRMYSRNCCTIISHPRLSSLVTLTIWPLMNTLVTKGKLNISVAKGLQSMASPLLRNSSCKSPGTRSRSATNFITAGLGVISA